MLCCVLVVCAMQLIALKRYFLNHLNVCLCVCLQHRPSTIATAVFVRSSLSNLPYLPARGVLGVKTPPKLDLTEALLMQRNRGSILSVEIA